MCSVAFGNIHTLQMNLGFSSLITCVTVNCFIGENILHRMIETISAYEWLHYSSGKDTSTSDILRIYATDVVVGTLGNS